VLLSYWLRSPIQSANRAESFTKPPTLLHAFVLGPEPLPSFPSIKPTRLSSPIEGNQHEKQHEKRVRKRSFLTPLELLLLSAYCHICPCPFFEATPPGAAPGPPV